MGSGIFNVGVTGLNAAQAGILTSGHNIANASTPGYNRQEIVQTSNTPLFTGNGFMGQGTNIQTVRRVYSDFLTKQVLSAETNVAELNTYATEINQIDAMLADPTAGLGPAMQSFFDSTSQVATTPTSIPARQAMLSAAQGLVSRFQGLQQQLSGIRDGVNAQITTEVGTINSLVSQVSDLNQRIILAQAAGSSQPANDLYDQRDQLISDLNKEIRISVQKESDGSLSLFFGTGQPLVVGVQTYNLQAVAAAEDLTQLVVALVTPGGHVQQLPESLVTGGKLSGLLQFRTETLDTAQNSLGRLALAVTTTVNQQNRLGQDLSGNLGSDIFKPIALGTLGAPTNVGSATLSANLVMSDYRVTYDGSAYTVTRLADNTATNFGQLPLNIDGIDISLASGTLEGTPANPDVFIIKPGALPGQRVTRMSRTPQDTGMLATTGSNLQTLTTSDYRLTLSATNTFTLTRLSDGQAWSASGATQQEALAAVMAQTGPLGFNLELSNNTAYVGDSFLVRPTRYAARDIDLSISDPRAIAAATPVRTAAAATNTGTATMTSGVVSRTAVALSAPFDVRYDAATDSFVGFPAGATVMVGSTTYKVTNATTRIPYAAGVNISLNGVGVVISGAPADRDTFTISPTAAGLALGAGNTGGGSIVAGTPTSTLSLPVATIPMTFRRDNGAGLPDRLTGLPVGSVVTLTPPNGGTPTEYPISAATDYVPFTSGATIAFNGVSFAITGAPADGDVFSIGPNPSGAGDGRNVLAIQALQTINTLADGGATFQTSYAQMVSEVGNKAREVAVTQTAQENLSKQNQDAVQSMSGVNLDEEAANLMRFQQAYQASAKMLDMAAKLFDSLLAIAG